MAVPGRVSSRTLGVAEIGEVQSVGMRAREYKKHKKSVGS